MFKRFLLLFMVLALVFSFAACSSSETENADGSESVSASADGNTSKDASDAADESGSATESASTPVLYKVTDADGDVLWLFGSIHVGRESFYPLPDYVMDAFEGADSLAVEFNLVAFEQDMTAQIEAMTPLVYADGTTIEDHISAELYDSAKAVLTDLGVYSSMLDYYCPMIWSNTIQTTVYAQLGFDTTTGVDRYMIGLADEQGKEIVDIESAKMQYQMMANFSDGVHSMLLESSVKSMEDLGAVESSLMQMLEAWEKGDEEALAKLLSSETDSLTEEQKVLYEEYNKALITDRNQGMLEFATDALDSDKEVFVCVGAAHILGEGGLADLLAQLGYTVEIVPSK